jgi:hypothetical protein
MKKASTPVTTQWGMTVGDLREVIKGLPDHTPVLYQRIEDVYFKKRDGWQTIKLPWDNDSTSEYMRAWCAFKTKYKGRKILGIDAHY